MTKLVGVDLSLVSVRLVGKRPKVLSITHKLNSDHVAKFDVGQS